MGHTDAELVERTREGDADAFAALVDRHRDPLVRYLSRLTGNRDRAEELAQDTFVRFWERAAARYEDRGRLGAYLFRIGSNLLRSQERRRTTFRLRLPSLVAADLLPGPRPEPSPSHNLLADETAAIVRRELSRLPVRLRIPLVLYELEGWSYREIGAFLGCREGTVKSRLHRGRVELKRRLAPFWAERDEATTLPLPVPGHGEPRSEALQ